MKMTRSRCAMKVGILSVELMAGAALGQGKPAQTPIADAAKKTQEKVQTDVQAGKLLGEAILDAKSGSKTSGTVVFTTTDKGLKVTASIKGATAGKHGIHIHEKGDCSAPDASSAGGHFNPTTAPHAGPEDQPRHGGDLGNITVNQDGSGVLNADIPNLSGLNDWQSIIGKSVVVHEKADDLKSQPSGDSGARIACGVIAAAKTQRAAR